MTELFDSWSDEQLGSLTTYMMNSDVDPSNYNEVEEIMDKLVEEGVERGLIQE